MDLLQQIPKLSRHYSVFKHFPGPEKMHTFFKLALRSRKCGHTGYNDYTATDF